ncbi:MAG: LysR family transcriptional regulator [Clostridia bacterium]|nr:LysR family transcriptional regulator [Clostridia bacterium]
MNEEQIETFLAVARYKTFTRAAELLFLTQPTVSHRINTLEKEMGVQLFVRGRDTADLTPAGQAFWPRALKLWKDIAAVYRELRPYSETLRPIVVGFPALMVQGEYLAYHAVMRQDTADLRLRARTFDAPEEGLELLQAGDIDLMFGDISLPVFKQEAFACRMLFQGSAYACVHRGHRLASKQVLRPGDLKGETVLTYRDSTFFSDRMRQLLSPYGIEFCEGLDPAEETARLLRPDHGVMLVNLCLAKDRWLHYARLELPSFMPVGVIWRRDDAPESLMKLVRRLEALPENIWRR